MRQGSGKHAFARGRRFQLDCSTKDKGWKRDSSETPRNLLLFECRTAEMAELRTHRLRGPFRGSEFISIRTMLLLCPELARHFRRLRRRIRLDDLPADRMKLRTQRVWRFSRFGVHAP
jgi:hypothetical protein